MLVQSPAEQLFFTTVRLETESKTPDGAVERGAGTGFFYSYAEIDVQYFFIVSNKHVVLGYKRGALALTCADGDQPRLGDKLTVTLEDFDTHWYGHPDPDVDIAIMPFAPILSEISSSDRQIYFKAISHDLIPDAAGIQQFDAIEQVLFVGYPNNMYDTVNLTPIARVGVTATPIALDYSGRKAFLIDASVFPGSSGSPVMILNTGSYSPKGGGLVVGGRALFLGILSAVFVRISEGNFEIVDIPTGRSPKITTEEAIDLGYVYKSELVQDTVNKFLASMRQAQRA